MARLNRWVLGLMSLLFAATSTNDRDDRQVAWLFRAGEAGRVYLIKSQPELSARYLKPAGANWILESEIHSSVAHGRVTVTSVTERGKSRLTLIARFDSDNRLIDANATTENEGKKQTVHVVAADGKVRVSRHGGEETELDCPPGVLVTSAPDWTDAMLMVRRYDKKRGGRQEFAGLWIHPVQQPLRPTFVITQHGAGTIRHRNRDIALDRFVIELRGGTRYVALADQGKLVWLAPEKSPKQCIVLEGWESSNDLLAPLASDSAH